MRYRVAFARRMQSDGADSTMRPSAELDLNLSDGVVAEKAFVEQLETEAQHSQEVLDEDDAFLGSAAPEVWEYEVVDARCAEFEEAVRNADLVLEYDVVDSTPTTSDETAEEVLGQAGVYPADGGNDAVDVTSSGSGVRAGDDGPAGMPTGDPSAGGLGRNRSREEFGPGSSGGIDDLTVMKGTDPRLGLTNRGQKPVRDWAANTGPAQNPDRGVAGEGLADEASTLRPGRRKKNQRQN